MDTPIFDFVKRYAENQHLWLHMPGHKGKALLGPEPLDITEVEGADVLYHADGVIRRSEENAAELFGTARTLYSAEGSSLCIRAMLYLTVLYAKANGKKPVIAAGRNAHQTFMTAAALLDVEIRWLYPENRDGLISCDIDAAYLERFFASCRALPVAVYVTSPDYLGNLLDMPSLSAVCRRYGVLLLVDNAHGAYLRFLPQPLHPAGLGADLCCDSAHKTLPVLTGGAYLHISRSASSFFLPPAEKAMALFASTSPSYLILQSLDLANRTLAGGYSAQLRSVAEKLAAIKKVLAGSGYTLIGKEPMKLTVAAKTYGYTGTDLAKILWENKIVCEFSDPDFVVMMVSAQTEEEELEKLCAALLQVKRKEPIQARPPAFGFPVPAVLPKTALFSAQEEIPVREAEGRILASAVLSCPPAIPVAVCGERLDKQAVCCLEYYGVKTCFVTVESGNRQENREKGVNRRES